MTGRWNSSSNPSGTSSGNRLDLRPRPPRLPARSGRRPARALPRPGRHGPGTGQGPARGGGGPRRGGGGQLPREIDAWLHIGEDGTVTASTGKAEVGQNIRTSLTKAVADELKLPVESVHLVMGDTDHVPFDMGTFGSRTTPTMVPQMRRAAAAARGLLLDLAAEEWGVDRGSLGPRAARSSTPATGRTIGYGELTKGRKLVETIGDEHRDHAARRMESRRPVGPQGRRPRLRDRAAPLHQRPRAARHAPGQGAPAPDVSGARLASLDTSRAEAMPGVKVVRDGDFVGVVAPSEFLATRALAALQPTWTAPDGPATSDKELCEFLKAHPEQGNQGNGNRSAERERLGQGRARGRSREGRGGLHDRLHRPCAARAPRRGGRMGGRR